jgi:hypothetical protein
MIEKAHTKLLKQIEGDNSHVQQHKDSPRTAHGDEEKIEDEIGFVSTNKCLLAWKDGKA